jgi:hypothetical protein
MGDRALSRLASITLARRIDEGKHGREPIDDNGYDCRKYDLPRASGCGVELLERASSNELPLLTSSHLGTL